MPPTPSIVIEFPGAPKTKKNHHRTTKRSKRLYLPTDIVEYEEQVKLIATEAMKKAGWPGPWAGRVTIAMDIAFPSWHEKDIQNYFDSVLDGMSGAVYDDDCIIDRTIQCRQKSSDNPGITVYVWFHDFDLNELGKRRPREWSDLSVMDFDFPDVYPIVATPADCTNRCRYATYGPGRKKFERDQAAMKRALAFTGPPG